MATYLRQSLTSACPLTSILRALFCKVARPMVNCTFYLQTGTSVRVWRCHVTYDQHPRTQLYYWIFPIFIPTSNHILPRRRRGRHRPPSVGWSYVLINTWSLLPPNSSPAGAIHQQGGSLLSTDEIDLNEICVYVLRKRWIFYHTHYIVLLIIDVKSHYVVDKFGVVCYGCCSSVLSMTWLLLRGVNIITLRASCGAVYCNPVCVWVCGWVYVFVRLLPR